VKLGSTGVQSGAGDLDDNLNFVAFQRCLSAILKSDSGRVLPDVSLAGRVALWIVDSDGGELPILA
jgi:hypothetical protein